MAGLSAEQQGLVDQKRLQPRPQYYSAISRQLTTIGDGLEAFLVLVEPDLREEILDRLGQANEGANPDRDALYAEAITLETRDASTKLTDFEVVVADFEQFRDRILQSTAGTSTEVAPLIQDIQRNFGSVVEDRERTFHVLQTARVLDTLRRRAGGTSDEVQQRDSWTDVIAQYR